MRRLQIAAASLIFFAWVITLGDGMITHDYQAVDVATPVVLVAAGFVFGDSILRKRYAKETDDS